MGGGKALIAFVPDSLCDVGDTLDIRIRCTDTGGTGACLDSSYSVIVGQSILTLTHADTLLPAGCLMQDDSTGLIINVPQGAVSDTLLTFIGFVDRVPNMPDSLRAVGRAKYIGPDGLKFNLPVTVGMPFTQGDLDSSQVSDAEALSVFSYVTGEGLWKKMEILYADATHVYFETGKCGYLSYGRATGSSTAVPGDDSAQPLTLMLNQNYPNPFNPETHITFTMAKPGQVSLSVYDLRGRKVRQLVNELMSAGRHETIWHGTNDAGDCVASGVYFYVLRCGDQVVKKKCVLLK